jgi:hypothetical protein
MSQFGGWSWRWLAVKWYRGSVAFVIRLGPVHGWNVHFALHRPRERTVAADQEVAG